MGTLALSVLAAVMALGAAALLLPWRLAATLVAPAGAGLHGRVALEPPFVPPLVLWDSARARPGGPAPGRPRSRRGGGATMRRAGPRLVLRLVPRLLRAVRVERLRIDGTFGLADPADTGIVLGMVRAAGAVMPRGAVLRLAPDFTGPALLGEAEATLRFRPATLVWPLLRFAGDVRAVRRAGSRA